MQRPTDPRREVREIDQLAALVDAAGWQLLPLLLDGEGVARRLAADLGGCEPACREVIGVAARGASLVGEFPVGLRQPVRLVELAPLAEFRDDEQPFKTEALQLLAFAVGSL